MAIVQVTIVPLGTGTPSLSEYVAEVHQELEQSAASGRIKYQLTPMSTIIEGDLDELLAIVRRMHEVPFANGAARVSTTLTIDDRRDKQGTMEQKLLSVEEKLKR